MDSNNSAREGRENRAPAEPLDDTMRSAMKDYRKRKETFMKKYGYLALKHPIEFAAMYFFAMLGALSLVSDIFDKIDFKLPMLGRSKYLFCIIFSLIQFSYWKYRAKQQESESADR